MGRRYTKRDKSVHDWLEAVKAPNGLWKVVSKTSTSYATITLPCPGPGPDYFETKQLAVEHIKRVQEWEKKRPAGKEHIL